MLEELPLTACHELNAFIGAANELADTHDHAETELRAHLGRSVGPPLPAVGEPLRVMLQCRGCPRRILGPKRLEQSARLANAARSRL